MQQDSNLLRLFIAVAVPEHVRQRIAEFQSRWQCAMPPHAVRWNPPEQIHLTLRFMGDVAAEALPALEQALTRAAAGMGGFELAASGSGCFPDATRPRVLWVGVGGELTALGDLQARVARETAAWGEIETRPFHPHLTLGRVKPVPPPVVRQVALVAQSQVCGELGRWRVDEVVLMRSELLPTGAQHTKLARCVLGGVTPGP